MPGPGFWVGIGVAILVIFALTWFGAWLSRRARLDDGLLDVSQPALDAVGVRYAHLVHGDAGRQGA